MKEVLGVPKKYLKILGLVAGLTVVSALADCSNPSENEQQVVSRTLARMIPADCREGASEVRRVNEIYSVFAYRCQIEWQGHPYEKNYYAVVKNNPDGTPLTIIGFTSAPVGESGELFVGTEDQRGVRIELVEGEIFRAEEVSAIR